jgi:hypothetical protein
VEGAVGSGIVDPVASNLNRIFLPGKNYKPYQLALDILFDRDSGRMNDLVAYREVERELAA